MMDKRKILLILLGISTILTLLGLGFSAYIFYVFDKPFLNSTTKGLLSAFFLSLIIISLSLSKTKK
ncbi:hypothetical protein MHJ88_06675 [Streptococcus cristatus]|nr:hypothetical protein [Streptococcus cristatus]MCG7330650.1 hypothetical protein [Streptococcus cristatus]